MGCGLSKPQKPRCMKMSKPIMFPLTSPATCFTCHPDLKRNRSDDAFDFLEQRCASCGAALCAPITNNMCILDFPTMTAHMSLLNAASAGPSASTSATPASTSATPASTSAPVPASASGSTAPALGSASGGGAVHKKKCFLGVENCPLCQDPRIFMKFSHKRDVLMDPLNDHSSSHVYGCKVFQTAQHLFWYWCRAKAGFVYMGLQYLGPREKASQFLYHACVYSPLAKVQYTFYHPLYDISENLHDVEKQRKCFVMKEELFNRLFFTPMSKIILIISDKSI